MASLKKQRFGIKYLLDISGFAKFGQFFLPKKKQSSKLLNYQICQIFLEHFVITTSTIHNSSPGTEQRARLGWDARTVWNPLHQPGGLYDKNISSNVHSSSVIFQICPCGELCDKKIHQGIFHSTRSDAHGWKMDKTFVAKMILNSQGHNVVFRNSFCNNLISKTL